MSAPVIISLPRVAGITAVVVATPGKGVSGIIANGLSGQDWPIVLGVKPNQARPGR